MRVERDPRNQHDDAPPSRPPVEHVPFDPTGESPSVEPDERTRVLEDAGRLRPVHAEGDDGVRGYFVEFGPDDVPDGDGDTVKMFLSIEEELSPEERATQFRDWCSLINEVQRRAAQRKWRREQAPDEPGQH